MNSTAPLHCC